MPKRDKKNMLTADLHCFNIMSKVSDHELDGPVFKAAV